MPVLFDSRRILFLISIGCWVFLTLITSCVPKNSADNSASLEGTWKFLYSESHFPDTTLRYDSTDINSIYLIGTEHFSFISIDPDTEELMFAGSGEYELDDQGNYIEKIELHTSSHVQKTSISFDSKLEGDIWIHEGIMPIREEDSLLFQLAKGTSQYRLVEVRRRIP